LTESIRKCEGKSLYNLGKLMFWYSEVDVYVLLLW